MNRIIITGITGFMGSNIKRSLKDKYSILGVSRNSKPQDDIIAYEEISDEVLNISKVLIHLAGKAHDLKKTTEDQEYFKVNTDLTINLFDKFLESTCEIFVFMSTVKAVTDTVDGILYEDNVREPQSIYGKSKAKAEEYILSKEVPDNKRVYILRPCMVHGANNKGNLNLLYTILNKGIPYPLGSFENRRSFLSVDNLSFIIEKLLDLKPPSNIFHLSDDYPLSTIELVVIIGKTINKETRVLNFPKPFIKFLARIGDIIPLPLNTEKLTKLTENYVISNSKIKTIVGDLPLTSEQGIIKTVNSFSQN